MSFRRGFLTCLVAASAASAGLFALACSSSSTNVVAKSPDDTDSSTPPDDGGGPITKLDAGADAPSGTCEGTCKTTALVVDIGGKMRTLVRAQFGTQQGDGGAELYTESHLGGSAACPTPQSPSTDYTLIVAPVPRGATGKKLSDRDGITSTFFDFKGDLGVASPSGFTKALGVSVTVVAEDPATPPAWVAFDVVAAFTEGQVKGHVYAEYCDSLTQ
jgi:hypothetical protein